MRAVLAFKDKGGFLAHQWLLASPKEDLGETPAA